MGSCCTKAQEGAGEVEGKRLPVREGTQGTGAKAEDADYGAVVPAAEVDERFKAQWKRILKASFDNPPDFFPLAEFRNSYRHAEGGREFEAEEVNAIFLELKRFLFLCAITPTEGASLRRHELVPSPMVDRMWRIIVAQTAHYYRLCSEVLGIESGGLPRNALAFFSIDNYKATQKLYKKFFVSPSKDFWPPF